VESIIAFGIITGIAIGLIKESCLGSSETGTHYPAEDEAPAPKPVVKKVPAKKPVAKKPVAKKASVKKASVKKPAAKKAPAKKAAVKK
jgi:hypothetical protein